MAARLGNFELVQLLLQEGADVNAPPAVYNGRTALQGAAESGNWKILSLLQSAGAQINAPAGVNLGLTALQAACLNGHPLMAGFLLAHQANLYAAPSPVMGLTPIQAAAIHGDIGLMKDLISLGADVNAPATETTGTVLLTAMRHRLLSLLELLLEHGANINPIVDYRWQSPLAEAACLRWLEGVKFLLKRRGNVNAIPLELTTSDGRGEFEIEWGSPLGWAIANGDEGMVHLLLKHGADVLATAIFDWRGRESTLICALHASFDWVLDRDSSVDIIHLLLAKVPELENHPGWEDALKIVLEESIDHEIFDVILGKLNSLSLPLRRKAIQKGWDELPSEWCAEEEDEEEFLEVFELLIKSGPDLEGRAKNGSTLLQRLAGKGYYQPCCLLISHGATVNTLAVRDWGTPLQGSLKRKSLKLADFLLEQGADVYILPADNRGVTALQAASMHGMLGLAVRLLESGADVSAPVAPNDGRTAIDAAAENGHKEMVHLLLNALGDQDDLGPVCHQAAGYAEKEDHFEIAQWLREYSSA